MKAIRIHRQGGPEVMKLESVELPPPAAGEVSLRHEAIGINFIDTYHRSGLYPVTLPSGLGMEGAGVVTAVGPGVGEFQTGDRVAYCAGPLHGYGEARNIAADLLVPVPAEVGLDLAAAMMLKGLTAEYLVRRTYPVQAGDPVLVHAAAGGVGQLLCQWAKDLGAQVIGTVGSEAKIPLARASGCDHVLLTGRTDLAAEVRRLSGGEGVAVVYDGVGRDTWESSLSSLRPLGMMVSYGNASGVVPPVDLLELTRRGSLFVTRPTLFTHTRKRADFLAMAESLFAMVAAGLLRIDIGGRYHLADAVRAHQDLEARRTTGSLLLMP